MKKYISVLSIVVRSSIYKILLILFGMGVLQIGMFLMTMDAQNVAENTVRYKDVYVTENIQSLDYLIEFSYTEKIFMTAFALICLVLTWAVGAKKASKTDYFYNRLSVGVAERYVIFSIYCIFCIWLLIVVQVGIVYVMGQLYLNTSRPDFISPQMYFLAFYRSDFLHSILPMANISKWIRNVLLILALSTEIARYGCTNKRINSVILVTVMVILVWPSGMTVSAYDIIAAFAAVVAIGINVLLMKEYAPRKQKEVSAV